MNLTVPVILKFPKATWKAGNFIFEVKKNLKTVALEHKKNA